MKQLTKEKYGNWKIKIRCTGRFIDDIGCQASFWISSNDIQVEKFYSRTFGSNITAFCIKCPSCGQYTVIPKIKIPGIVRRNICTITIIDI